MQLGTDLMKMSKARAFQNAPFKSVDNV